MSKEQFQYKLAILRVLSQCQGYLMAQPSLMNQVRLECAPPPSTAEFNQALSDLEMSRMAISVRDQLGGPNMWRITNEGRSELAAQP